MKTTSHLTPWRVQQQGDGGPWEVWTRKTDEPGSLNNYVVAGEIQFEDEAQAISAVPELIEGCQIALQNLTPIYSSDHLVIKTLRAALTKAGCL